MKLRFKRRVAPASAATVNRGGSELRAAVVGLGKLGLLHAATLNALPNSTLVAVADPTRIMLSAIGSTMPHVATFADHRQMIEQCRPDVVAIATPTGLHCAIATECVAANIPVFIEKPLAANVAQVAPLLTALHGNRVTTMVGYMTRFLPTFRKAKEIIASGILGKGQMFRSSMYIWQLSKTGKGWRYDPKQSGGGVLITQNSHLIDLLLWYFGDVEWVSAHTSSLYSKTVEDHAHVVFGFASGLRGFLDASWSARHYRTPSIRIHYQAENGTLDVEDDLVRLYVDERTGEFEPGWHVWNKPDLVSNATIDIGGAHYTAQMEQFLGAVQGNRSVDSDVESALRVQFAMDAAYASAQANGSPIDVGVSQT